MNTIVILLIEDNLADVVLIRLALKKSPVPTQLYVMSTVKSALAFLQGDEHLSQPVRPTLIIVDLNLPGGSGYDFLRELKSRSDLAGIPVVVFTSSVREEDRTLSQTLQAVDFIQKPLDVDEYFTCIQNIVTSWGLRSQAARPASE